MPVPSSVIPLSIPSIDVAIPVYNAPELTRRCIDSVVACLGRSIEHIYIQDDASGTETRQMLDHLPDEHIHVHHAPKNQGFGASVNEAINRSHASCVLVLNSDVEVSEDFLPSMYAALAADPQLAVIIPAGNDYAKHDLDQYLRRPGGYILTHRLQGHAFLIRRDVFLEIGGFDPAFGRGRAFRQLARRNRNLYYSRYPNAQRNVLLLSGNSIHAHFPPNLMDAVENVSHEGGYVHWLAPGPPHD